MMEGCCLSFLQEIESSVDQPTYTSSSQSQCAGELPCGAAKDAIEMCFGSYLLEDAFEVAEVELLADGFDDGALVLADLVCEGLFCLVPDHSLHWLWQFVIEFNFGFFLVDLLDHACLLVVELALQGSLLSLDLRKGLRLDAADLILKRVEAREVVDALSLEAFQSRDPSRNCRIDFALEIFEDFGERFALVIDHIGSPVVEALKSLIRFGVELGELIMNHFLGLLSHHQLHKCLPILLLQLFEHVSTANIGDLPHSNRNNNKRIQNATPISTE